MIDNNDGYNLPQEPAMNEQQFDPTALALVPVSHATNAFDHMEEVNQAILAEPQRLNMPYWVMKVAGVKHLSSSYFFSILKPACNTVACYAGWTAILAGYLRIEGWDTLDLALDLLSKGQSRELRKALHDGFLAGEVYSDDNSDYDPDAVALTAGTPEYAAAVVKRFRAIMTTYETELRAVRITVKARTV